MKDINHLIQHRLQGMQTGTVAPVNLHEIPPNQWENYDCIAIPDCAPQLARFSHRDLDAFADWLSDYYKLAESGRPAKILYDLDPDVADFLPGTGFSLCIMSKEEFAKDQAYERKAREIYAAWQSENLADRPGHEFYDAKMKALE